MLLRLCAISALLIGSLLLVGENQSRADGDLSYPSAVLAAENETSYPHSAISGDIYYPSAGSTDSLYPMASVESESYPQADVSMMTTPIRHRPWQTGSVIKPVQHTTVVDDYPQESPSDEDVSFLLPEEEYPQSTPSCTNRLRKRCSWFFNAWIDQGFTWNGDRPVNGLNRPVVYNDRANYYQMNQLYLAAGRNVRREGCKWDFGGRIDFNFGTDSYYMTAEGLETDSDGFPHWNKYSRKTKRGGGSELYGIALPQFYGEVYTPWLGGWAIKFGHFYSDIGYESAMAPQNFFYSHSYSRAFGEPLTNTGFLASHEIGHRMSVHGGMTLGWDRFDNPDKTYSFAGGIEWTNSSDRLKLSFNIETGNEEPGKNSTVYSLVARWKICPDLIYVFQHDLGYENDGAVSSNLGDRDANWYSIVNYIYWHWSECLSVGLRAEWFSDPDYARVFPGFQYDRFEGSDYSEVTLGLNWRPCDHIVVRPEVRWDSSGVQRILGPPNGVYDTFTQKDQFTTAISVLLTY